MHELIIRSESMKEEFKKMSTYTLVTFLLIAACSLTINFFANKEFGCNTNVSTGGAGLPVGVSFILIGAMSLLYLVFKLIIYFRRCNELVNMSRLNVFIPIVYLISTSVFMVFSSVLIIYSASMLYCVEKI